MHECPNEGIPRYNYDHVNDRRRPVNFTRIKMALYATVLTNWYGLKLKFTPEPAQKKRLRIAYSETLMDALNIAVEVKHPEKLPKEGTYLLVSNHRSIIDPIVIEIALRETELFGLWVSKKELYNSFFFGLFTRNAGSILLDREAAQMSGFFKDVKAGVDAGASVFLFPEGTRNKENTELSGFKEGARVIAVKNRLPILPLYIRTNAEKALEEALNDGSRRVVVTVEVGDIIDYKDRAVPLETAYRNMFGLARS
jgi:1-acyl-sn-glycerol-3-phosphate acyltransferase